MLLAVLLAILFSILLATLLAVPVVVAVAVAIGGGARRLTRTRRRIGVGRRAGARGRIAITMRAGRRRRSRRRRRHGRTGLVLADGPGRNHAGRRGRWAGPVSGRWRARRRVGAGVDVAAPRIPAPLGPARRVVVVAVRAAEEAPSATGQRVARVEGELEGAAVVVVPTLDQVVVVVVRVVVVSVRSVEVAPAAADRVGDEVLAVVPERQRRGRLVGDRGRLVDRRRLLVDRRGRLVGRRGRLVDRWRSLVGRWRGFVAGRRRRILGLGRVGAGGDDTAGHQRERDEGQQGTLHRITPQRPGWGRLLQKTYHDRGPFTA